LLKLSRRCESSSNSPHTQYSLHHYLIIIIITQTILGCIIHPSYYKRGHAPIDSHDSHSQAFAYASYKHVRIYICIYMYVRRPCDTTRMKQPKSVHVSLNRRRWINAPSPSDDERFLLGSLPSSSARRPLCFPSLRLHYQLYRLAFEFGIREHLQTDVSCKPYAGRLDS